MNGVAFGCAKIDKSLLDIRLPGESGIEATRQISKRFPRSKVIMLTSFADDSMIFRAISAGAVGYVLKQVEDDDLFKAITVAARGDAVLDPTVTSPIFHRGTCKPVLENTTESEWF